MIQRADGRVDLIGQSGFPVGLLEEARFELIEDRLAPGDRLLLISDGVTECTDAQGDMLGEDGLIRMLDELRGVEGSSLLESIVWTLAQRRSERNFDDDVSGIVLEFTDQSS